MAPNETLNERGTETSDVYAAELAPEASAPPAARAPRKRASRRVTTQATAIVPAADRTSERATESATDAPEATEQATSDDGAAPVADAVAESAPAAKRAPRKRAPRKKAAAPEVAPPAVVDPDAFIEHDDLFADLLAGIGNADDDEDADEVDEVRPAVPTFGLLFQAPDPAAATRSRRRRPQPVEVDESDDSDDVDFGGTATFDEPARVAASDADEAIDSDETTDSPDDDTSPRRSRRRRGGKGRRGRGPSDDTDDESGEQSAESDDDREGDEARPESDDEADNRDDGDDGEESTSSRRRRRRRRAGSSATDSGDDTPNVSTRVRQPRALSDEPVAVKGSTRLEAKKQRRREGREAGRRRTIITEAEFLARREAVDRVMVVRNKDGRTQMGVLEDGVLVEHYIDQATNVSMAGNIYLGRVQNVLPSMEAAFVDIGKGRNAVLYAGEVNWDAAGLDANQPKRIEHALSSGQAVLVQVTKDPIGHKGARLTSQISLPGRYLVYVPNSSMTGISRKLPDTERARLKKILRDVVPDTAGVIVRTAAEGASEEELRADVERLTRTWDDIQARAEGATTPKAGKSKGKKKNGGTGSAPTGNAPLLLHGEPDLTVRVIRDVFNEDFKQLVVSGEQAWNEIHPYISSVAPDLADRVTKWTGTDDLFTHHRVDEQLAKAMDRKVWLPSGGSLVIDRTEAMTVVDVNTGKFVGSGGNLEETVTKNNIEAAEEIVRQLRLRDIGGIIVIDFIDMVLESNRDLVVRRLLECLGRDRTKHQVAEVTSLGLVQMTRKRVGSGLIEVFSETCDHCNGRGFIIHTDPVAKGAAAPEPEPATAARGRRTRRGAAAAATVGNGTSTVATATTAAPAADANKPNGPTAAQIAAAAHAAAVKAVDHAADGQDGPLDVVAETEGEAQAAPQGAADHEGDDHEVAEHVVAEHEAPHSFPDDDGPWGGDDSRHEDAPDATTGGEHVELESDSYDATPAVAEPAPDAAETAPEATPEPAPEPAPAAAPGRRRRGRVIAPAGPPRGQFGSDPSEPVI